MRKNSPDEKFVKKCQDFRARVFKTFSFLKNFFTFEIFFSFFITDSKRVVFVSSQLDFLVFYFSCSD